MAEATELGDVARERERDGPVGDDAQLPREERQLVEAVRPRQEPADEAARAESRADEDALVAAERPRLPEHPVAVGLEVAREVLREAARLAEGVLGGRRVRRVRGGVRHAGPVAERPRVLDADDAQVLV